jgi:hypothetical protein
MSIPWLLAGTGCFLIVMGVVAIGIQIMLDHKAKLKIRRTIELQDWALPPRLSLRSPYPGLVMIGFGTMLMIAAAAFEQKSN